MTTLHRVAEVTKKISIGFGIGVLSIIFLILVARLFINIKEAILPTPPPPPTVTFGKLPSIIFPESTLPTLPKLTLSTVSGNLPNFPDRMTLYKFAQPQINFSSLEKAKQIASTNNFTDNPTSVSDTLYQWENTAMLDQKLLVNILTFDFSLSSNYLEDPTILAATNLGDQVSAVQTMKDFLNGFTNQIPSDIDSTKTQTALFSIQNNTLIPASSLSNAQVIRVDMYQADVNKIPIYYPHYPQSLIESFVASGQYKQQVVAATFVHRAIDTTTNATYPIKTAQQAFSELQNGNGYIANYDTPNQPAIIRSVSLGYYIGDDPSQAYLMPIIVFQGDNNFYAFVPAITDAWIKK